MISHCIRTIKKLARFSKQRSSGMTVVEMVVVVAILGILSVPLSRFIMTALRDVTKSDLKVKSSEDLRMAFDIMERDFMEINEVITSSATFIEFRRDSYRLPAYDPQGDMDGDGIVNIKDADDDNDITTFYAATATWRGGYDIKDDDDDNNGQVDVACRYYLTGTTVSRDFNYNGAGWGANVDVLATNISSFTLAYYGSKQENLGRNIDLGNDGTAATADAGENDGIISQREIDWVQPATGHGNRSGLIDTANEKRYITTIYFRMAQDRNKDGKDDYTLDTQLAPPLLPIKRNLF